MVMAVVVVEGVGDHENHNHGFEVVWDKFGPPDPSSSTASVEMALSLTTAIWAYVPSLLIAELAFEMESPEHLSRSIALSAGLVRRHLPRRRALRLVPMGGGR